MSTEEQPVTIDYELPTGAIAILDLILKRGEWYKDDPKVGFIVKRARTIRRELPPYEKAPTSKEGESQDAYNERLDKWSKPILQFKWTDKTKDVARKCFSYFLKAGVFEINDNVEALIRLFQLDAE